MQGRCLFRLSYTTRIGGLDGIILFTLDLDSQPSTFYFLLFYFLSLVIKAIIGWTAVINNMALFFSAGSFYFCSSYLLERASGMREGEVLLLWN